MRVWITPLLKVSIIAELLIRVSSILDKWFRKMMVNIIADLRSAALIKTIFHTIDLYCKSPQKK